MSERYLFFLERSKEEHGWAGILSDGVAGCLQREAPRLHSAAPGDGQEQTDQAEADEKSDDDDRNATGRDDGAAHAGDISRQRSFGSPIQLIGPFEQRVEGRPFQ